MSDNIRAHYADRYVVRGRWAHLTKPTDPSATGPQRLPLAQLVLARLPLRRLLLLELLDAAVGEKTAT